MERLLPKQPAGTFRALFWIWDENTAETYRMARHDTGLPDTWISNAFYWNRASAFPGDAAFEDIWTTDWASENAPSKQARLSSHPSQIAQTKH